MKQYTLEVVIDGEAKKVNRTFSSRREALNFFFENYARIGSCDFVVNEVYFIDDNKHNREYVCDYNNRFRIARV